MPMLDPDMPDNELMKLVQYPMSQNDKEIVRFTIRRANAAAIAALTEEGVAKEAFMALWNKLNPDTETFLNVAAVADLSQAALTAAANALKEQANG